MPIKPPIYRIKQQTPLAVLQLPEAAALHPSGELSQRVALKAFGFRV